MRKSEFSTIARGGALLLLLLGAGRAQAQLTVRAAPLLPQNSGKCLMVDGASAANRARVVQGTCQGARHGLWTLRPYGDAFQVVAAHSNKCLNVRGASKALRAPVFQYTCGSGTNNLWKLERFRDGFRLRAKHSKLCLNVKGATAANGAALMQYKCIDAENEIFNFGEGFVDANQPIRVQWPATGQCAGISAGSTAANADGTLSDCTETPPAGPSQELTFTQVGASYRLSPRHSRLCLSAPSTGENARVLQAACNTDTAALWRMDILEGGLRRFVNRKSSRCLATSSGSLTVQTCVGTTQGWRLSTERELGAWDPLVTLPLVPVAGAMLQNRKVLFWAAYDPFTYTSSRDFAKTHTAVWDPDTRALQSETVSDTQHDMFCPSTSLLADGRLLVSGGASSSKTSLYTPDVGWRAGAPLAIPRGYHAAATLDDGRVFSIGGSWGLAGRGGKDGEVWSESEGWRRLPGAPASAILTNDPAGVYRQDNHAWLFNVGGGRVLHAGPSPQMNWFTVDNQGTVKSAGRRGNDVAAMSGNAVMFDAGKILTVGGAPAYSKANASSRAFLLDVSSAVATTALSPMARPRTFSNSVVLPDGRVLVVGGMTYAQTFSDRRSVLTPEVWSPVTRRFTPLAPHRVPRNYHSIALLLPDGRVLVGGGGLCGTCEVNHPDFEIYTPDYLFAPDGTRAVRPLLMNAPAAFGFGGQVQVSTNVPVSQFVLVRLSSVTHSNNNDQRRVPLPIVSVEGASTYTLTTPVSAGVATPGAWLLFALDAAGVPSEGVVVQLR